MNTGTSRRRFFEWGGMLGAGALVGHFVHMPARTGAKCSTCFRANTSVPAGTAMALSLRELQRRARKARSEGSPLRRDLIALGGIRSISGFAVDKDDVVVLGTTDDSRPPLHIDDLTVAFRSAYQVDGTYHEPPGCTIDPRFSDSGGDPFSIQDAKALGQPQDCRMAERQIRLDYELKRAGAGLVSLNGVRSAFETRGAESAAGERAETSREVSSRFWFCSAYYSDGPRYTVSSTGLRIDHPIGVQVQTERMMKDGSRGSGADPEAERFGSEVSQLIASDTRNEYREIVNDFRLIELANLVRHEHVPASALRYLLEEHQLERVDVPRYVTGIRRTETTEIVADGRIEVVNGGIRASLPQRTRTLTYRGGVEVVVEMQESTFSHNQAVRQWLAAALNARPNTESVIWASPA